jgi:hypothetical protein
MGRKINVTVKMTDHEWSSNTDMGLLARHELAKYPKTDRVVVHVQEHAGWYLEYGRDPGSEDGKIVVVGTANDAATVTEERRRFWRHWNEDTQKAEWVEVKRPALAPAEAPPDAVAAP